VVGYPYHPSGMDNIFPKKLFHPIKKERIFDTPADFKAEDDGWWSESSDITKIVSDSKNISENEQKKIKVFKEYEGKIAYEEIIRHNFLKCKECGREYSMPSQFFKHKEEHLMVKI
jgi:hypothetical protein